MLNNPRARRPLAILLVVLGGVLIFLAPEVWAGVVLLVLGVAIELAGISLERRNGR
ncbi:MAG: hypothetical protein AB1710_10895 [Pseudomonadota bacterium]